MKNLLSCLIVLFILTSCITYTKGQDGKSGINGKNGDSKNSKISFNQKLADSLGADKYGMKAYTIVMLTTGTAKIDDQAKMSELMKGHMTNIGKLANEGKIIVAGPFLEKKQRKLSWNVHIQYKI